MSLDLTLDPTESQVREWVKDTGMENLGKKLVNVKEKIEFEKPAMSLDVLLKYGNMLVEEQVRKPEFWLSILILAPTLKGTLHAIRHGLFCPLPCAIIQSHGPGRTLMFCCVFGLWHCLPALYVATNTACVIAAVDIRGPCAYATKLLCVISVRAQQELLGQLWECIRVCGLVMRLCRGSSADRLRCFALVAQENVKRVQLANEYLDGAALAGVGGSSLPENVGARVEQVRALCRPTVIDRPLSHNSEARDPQRCAD